MTVVVQFGFAMTPRWSPTSCALISGMTSGTCGSIRKAEDLSITIASALPATGTYSRETPPPALKNAMSILSNDAASSFSTEIDSPRNCYRFPHGTCRTDGTQSCHRKISPFEHAQQFATSGAGRAHNGDVITSHEHRDCNAVTGFCRELKRLE